MFVCANEDDCRVIFEYQCVEDGGQVNDSFLGDVDLLMLDYPSGG